MSNHLRGLSRLIRLVLHLLHGWWIMRRYFLIWPPARRDLAVQQWSQALLRIAGVQLQVKGAPVQGAPVLLVCNHISWLDIAVLHAAVHCRFISKDDVRDWPLMGSLATGAGTLYISRASRRDALRVVHHMAQVLGQGEALAFFPEGTTSDGSTVLPFHSNLFQSAIAADAPVQPLGLRFEDLHSENISFVPAYVGDESLLQSVWRTLGAPPLRAVVSFGPAQTAQGRDRRQFAADVRKEVVKLSAGA